MAPGISVSSPRDTLIPFLSSDQANALPYPPNFLPGARDVDTFYGTMRVYEWGPEHGDKVLLVHGDTTPVPMLGPIAQALVQAGCRVMLVGKFFSLIVHVIISASPSLFLLTC